MDFFYTPQIGTLLLAGALFVVGCGTKQDNANSMGTHAGSSVGETNPAKDPRYANSDKTPAGTAKPGEGSGATSQIPANMDGKGSSWKEGTGAGTDTNRQDQPGKQSPMSK